MLWRLSGRTTPGLVGIILFRFSYMAVTASFHGSEALGTKAYILNYMKLKYVNIESHLVRVNYISL